MKQLETCREDIITYFSTSKLTILDVDAPKLKTKLGLDYTEPMGRGFYTGVTIPYIIKYICEGNPESIEDFIVITDILLDLYSLGEIRSLECGHVNDMVIESKLYESHWQYSNVSFIKKINEKRLCIYKKKELDIIVEN